MTISVAIYIIPPFFVKNYHPQGLTVLYQHVWMWTGWKGMVDFLCLDWIWINNRNRDSERVVLSVTTRSCTTTSMSRRCEVYLWSHL